MSTSFAQLTADVYKLTNRPDLVNETALAVRTATLKFHQSDFYYKDLFETGVVFDTADYLQQLEIKTIIPRYRAMHFIRKVSNIAGQLILGQELEKVHPQNLFDSYGQHKGDVWYGAGATVNLRSTTQLQHVLLSCYLYPNVVPDSYSSWIADEFPDLIVYDAASTIFKTIGYDEQHAAYNKLIGEMFMVMKNSNITEEAS